MAKVTLSKGFEVGPVDRRLYGVFLENIGEIIYGGLYHPGHPTADANGFRGDVMELLRELKIEEIRCPGGNYVSGYHWRDGVGPKESRPKKRELAWHSIETNEIGTDEYAAYCRLVGADVMEAVNLGTGTPEEASELVEYCNLETGTVNSDLRARNGHEQPYGIKLWCLGNEMDGFWQIMRRTPEDYAQRALEAGKMMKWMDPSIELVACGSCSNEPGLDTYPEWDRIVLDTAYDTIDYLSLHRYYFYDPDRKMSFNVPTGLRDIPAFSTDLESYLQTVLSACDFIKGKKRSGKEIGISFDEWGVSTSSTVRHEGFGWKETAPDNRFTNLLDAVVYGMFLITFLNHADRVKIACESIAISGMIAADPGENAIRLTTFYPFLHASAYGRGVSMRCSLDSPLVETEHYGSVPALKCAAVRDGDELAIFAVNMDLENGHAFDVEALGLGELEGIERIELYDDEPLAANTYDNPQRLVPRALPLEGDIVLKKHSWNVLRYRMR